MKKRKSFAQVWLPAASIQAVMDEFAAAVRDDLAAAGVDPERIDDEASISFGLFGDGASIEIDGAEWHLPSRAEFMAEYRRAPAEGAKFSVFLHARGGQALVISKGHQWSPVNVSAEMRTREQIERVFEVVEQGAEAGRIPEPEYPPTPPPTVFIGHGQSAQWLKLKDHLQDQHGVRVVAFETGARAGHAVRDVLAEMLGEASFAVLVMTAEDEQGDGAMRARQNVVHEAGLFQGRLGFGRAIVLREAGVETFSNMDGIVRLDYPADTIETTFGDVLATLRREFPAG